MPLSHYERVFDACEPYLIARPPVAEACDHAPLGIAIPPANVIDPQRVAHGPFLGLVSTLDELTYGPRALTMPPWVFYDCGVMPGAVFGFARRAAGLPAWVRRALRVPDGYDGLVPMSMFLAIPMAHRRAQLVYTLCSINEVAPGAAPEGLWRLTLAAGSAALRVDVMVATSQWRSAHLGVYASMAPLKLMTAWTPAHDVPETATFYMYVDDDARASLLRGDVTLTDAADATLRYLDVDDPAALQALQRDIEGGLDVWVVSPPEIRGAETRVPLEVGALHPAKPGPADHFLRRFQG